MADRLLQSDPLYPALTGDETTEEKLRRILDYVAQLREQYRYILSRLEEDE